MSGETVALARIRARPGFDSQQIAYSRAPARLGYYVQSVWADSPAAMLRPLVVNALEAHPGIATVVDAAAPVHSRWRVELELLRLVHDFTGSDEGGRARITLRSVVYDMQLQRVVTAGVLEAVEPAASANAAGGAEAANEAADRLLERLAEQVADAFDREPES